MPATKTSAQLSFLEHAVRSVERGQAPADVTALDPLKTGVVFVHGIGSQMPGETLLQWSAPIIQALTAWRMNSGNVDFPIDPVARSEVNFGDGLSAIELRVPPAEGSSEERRWILTEAWWASTVSPPSLGTMTAWLGPQGASARIVAGILGNPEGTGPVTGGLIRLASILLVPFVSVLAALVLTGFALFRGISGIIPIAAVRDSAILTSFDTFLTGWFGDVRILLYDPAQSANIRGGLARAIRALRAQGCGHMVVVAHSGGAIVSYLTLTDPELADVQVDKLITFGEAWNLALRLSPKDPPDGSGLADRLRADITLAQPAIRWRDFWSTNDPAPDGGLLLCEIGAGNCETKPPTVALARPDAIRSAKVWNRRSLLDDHGTYWTNDEEFVIPVMREIDRVGTWGEGSIFYPADPTPADEGDAPAAAADASSAPSSAGWPPPGGVEPGPRAVRHRQRVATLAMWRQTAIAVPVAVIAIALGLFPDRLITIGHEINRLLGMVPGVSHLNGLIGWLQNIDQHEFPIGFTIGSSTIGFDLIDTMSFWGIGVLQAAVIISIFQLGSAWVRGFDAWPRGAPTYYAAFALETILFLLLAFALWLVLSGDNHGKLLGSGAAAWWPGILVTILTGVLAGGGSLLARAIRSPATTRAFGTVAAVVFIAAIACAVVAIFGPDGLPDAETAYVVIWVTFVILYRLGLSRWHHWDHLERQIACEPTAARPVNRWPAYLTSAALLLAVGAMSIAILDWENGQRFVIALLIVATGVAGAGYIVGTAVARNRSDPIAAPDSVESQSWL